MEEKELTPRGAWSIWKKRPPPRLGRRLSDGALYGALGQGQIILVHIYRVLEGAAPAPQMEGWAGGSIAGESAHRAAVLGDDKLHPGILEGGAELSDLLGVEWQSSLRRARGGIVT